MQGWHKDDMCRKLVFDVIFDYIFDDIFDDI